MFKTLREYRKLENSFNDLRKALRETTKQLEMYQTTDYALNNYKLFGELYDACYNTEFCIQFVSSYELTLRVNHNTINYFVEDDRIDIQHLYSQINYDKSDLDKIIKVYKKCLKKNKLK